MSKTLLTFAWIIEIFAVITGLSISLMVGIEAYQKNLAFGELGIGVAGFLNIFIACLPFVLVAVVELAKIPVVQAAYNVTNSLWRMGYTVLLIFLAFITFETAIQGFERNYRNQNFEIMEYRQQYNTLAITKNNIVYGASMLSTDRKSIIDEFSKQEKVFKVKYDADNKRLTEQREKLTDKGVKTDSIQKSITRLDKELDSITSEYTQATALLNQNKNNQVSRQGQLLSEQQERINNEIIEKIQRLESQRTGYRAEKSQLDIDVKNELADASIFSRSGIRGRHKELVTGIEIKIDGIESDLKALSITSLSGAQQQTVSNNIKIFNETYNKNLASLKSEYETEKSSIQKEISARSDDLTVAASSDEDYIKKQRQKIDADVANIQKTYNNNVEKLRVQKEKQIKNIEGNEKDLSVLRQQESDLLGEMTLVKTNINRAAGDSTVYRLANMFSSAETYADIPQEKANMVATIWFGSLALIIAVTGVLLALASEALLYQKSNEPHHKSLQLLKRFSKLLVDLRRRLRKPKIKTVFQEIEVIKEIDVVHEVEVVKEVEVERIVEIIKEVIVEKPVEVVREVPVDKVVFKEVPVEIIRKEIVHVPVYTSDPSLLKED